MALQASSLKVARLCCWLLAVLLLQGASQAFAQDARYIVRFKSATAVSKRNVQLLNQAAATFQEAALQDITRLPHDNAVVVRLRAEDAARIAARHDVEALEVDAPVWALRNTNDPLLSEQYSLQGAASTQVTNAWDTSVGSRKAMVAVIDTGVDLTHPDLRANLWKNTKEVPANKRDDDGNGCIDDLYGCDIVNSDGSPQDDNGHGTHVAGIIAAVGDNALGMAGVAWGTKIVAVKALDSQGNGFVSSIVKAIDYITTLKSRGAPIAVINLSLGGGGYSTALYRAVERARNHDILTVAAAGNEGANNDSTPLYPASFVIDSVLGVAATDQLGQRASYSNYGANSVQIAAPGSSIISTAPLRSGFQYRTLSGTSMASPHVAGILALIAGANRQLSMIQARTVLLTSAQSVPELRGFVRNGAFADALAAVQIAKATQGLPRIYGYVRRGTKGISAARVTVTSRSDPANTRSVLTAKDGSYSFSELSFGEYRVRARRKGFTFRAASVSATTPGAYRRSFTAGR